MPVFEQVEVVFYDKSVNENSQNSQNISEQKMSEGTWKKPEDVMKQIREKKRALQIRFRNSDTLPTPASVDLNCDSPTNPTPNRSVKRKNPFRYI